MISERTQKQIDLWCACQRFIRENEISCSETVYQTDRVIEGAYEFVEKVCEIVGYHIPEEEREKQRLIRAGICNPDGTLNEKYRNKPDDEEDDEIDEQLLND